MKQLPPIKKGHKRVLAIDPGTYSSGVIIYEFEPGAPAGGTILHIEKDIGNDDLLSYCEYGGDTETPAISEAAIEMVGYYGSGMSVGNEVYHTVLWIGRFYAALERLGIPVNLYLRKSIAYELCGNRAAKPPNIHTACRDRLGGKGTVKNPGKTFGVSSHAWDALAVALGHAYEIPPVIYPSVKGA